MRPGPVALLAAVALAAAACSKPPEVARVEVPSYTIEQFLGTTSYSGATFSPDDSKVLVSSDASGVFNAYAVPVAGGDPVALTQSTGDSIYAYSYFPDDERFLYGKDRGGDERTHVFVRELDGTSHDLTPGDELKAQFYGWSHDGKSFWIGTNERDERYFDVYEYRTDGYGRQLVYRNDEGLMLGAVAPDGSRIAFVRPHTTNDSDVWLWDRATKELTKLTDSPGEDANTSPEEFSFDGKSLYVTSDEGAEFTYLARIDLDTGDRKTLLRPDWDVSSADLSHGGTYLVVGVNEDARTVVHLYRVDGMTEIELPQPPRGDVTSVEISNDETRMAFYVSSSTQPRDLFVQELSGGEPRQLTRSLNPAIDPAVLVEGTVVRFPSWDGTEIPGLLYRPHQATPDARAPALVWVHGGPGGQSRLNYSGLIQYLVNHGYAIYAINNRGSSGYGKTFHALDDRRHGEADLDDVVGAKDMLAAKDFVDPDRIGVIGGSYGGYMVLAALAFRPEAFDVGVDLFGVANWVRTLESIPAWWESQREALYAELGDPAQDGERLRRISPLFHADRIEKPLLVLQGANDPRVLKVESDEMVDAVRKRGVPVDYVVFDDEGHGFRKKENQIEGYRKILEFLDRYLKQAPPPGA